MKHRIRLAFAAALVGLAPAAPALAQTGFPKLAPFTAARFPDGAVEVRIDGEWVRLLAIGDTGVDELLEFARATYADRWQKRVSEDLVEVLTGLGAPPGDAVDLKVCNADGSKPRLLQAVPMTERNRRMALEFNRAAGGAPAAGPLPATLLSPEQMAADLDVLFAAIAERFSYAGRHGVDAADLRARALAELRGPAPRERFGCALARVLAAYGDGHARVEPDPLARASASFLPFLTGYARGGLVAFAADRSRLLDPERPYLVELDGRPIAEFERAAAAYVAEGSDAFRRHRVPRILRCLGLLREDLKLPAAATVRVTLAAKGGAKRKSVALPVAGAPAAFGTWPQSESRRLGGDIGYLRIAEMEGDPAFIAAVESQLESFRDAKGLVIDVRGNGGGRRDLLLQLAPHFLDPAGGLVIANVAAKRLFPGERGDEPEGLLGNRALFPATASAFAPGEREQLERFAAGFEPEWSPPEGEFSAWHYLVLRPDPAAWRIRCPVVVLQDEGCFSATDIFLGAFDLFPDITLAGAGSGGGSGRVEPVRLPASGLEVLLSSMASFRPDGRLYDGNGVLPDVELEREPGDFVGASDTALEIALKRLRGGS